MQVENNNFDINTITVEDFNLQIEDKIGSGDFATVWEKKGSDPKRVFKVIQIKDFGDGTEAKIAKIAGDLSVGPIVHDTFIVGDTLAVIEMDDAGKTLGRWMEEVAEKDVPLPEPLKAAEISSKYTVVAIQKTNRSSIEETIDTLYKKAETFYFQLFSNVKKLAKNKISYTDLHVGNIILNPESEVKLIDFGSAQIHSTVKEAKRHINTPYNFTLLKKYHDLPELSKKSQKLIEWFEIDLSRVCVLM